MHYPFGGSSPGPGWRTLAREPRPLAAGKLDKRRFLMNAQRKNELRMLLAIVLTLATLMMGYVAMTVPVFAMTGPAIVTIALAVAAYFTWRSPAKPPEKTVRVAGRDLKDHS